MTALAHRLDRSLVIRAQRTTVFRFFSDSARFADWWGAGSTIDCRPGGAVKIVYPNAVVASGEVVAVEPGKRVVFTYGYANGEPFGPGASRVTVDLDDHPDGTLLRLAHDLPSAASREAHVPGWWFQLARFAVVVAADQHAGAAAHADRWFEGWNEPDAGRRRAAFAACATPGVRMQDDYACLAGIDELVAHVAGIQRHMPGLRLARAGAVRQCQGTALVDFAVQGPGGAVVARGTNVLTLAPDGRIAAVVGLAAPAGA